MKTTINLKHLMKDLFMYFQNEHKIKAETDYLADKLEFLITTALLDGCKVSLGKIGRLSVEEIEDSKIIVFNQSNSKENLNVFG